MIYDANKDEKVNKEDRRKFRGFASMPRSKVVAIAKIGGWVRSKQLGHNGYVELGRVGGRVRSSQLTHEDYVKMGRNGGLGNARRIKIKKRLLEEIKSSGV